MCFRIHSIHGSVAYACSQLGMAAETTHQFPRIKAVRAYVPKSSPSSANSHGADCHDVIDTHWIDGHGTPIAHPLSAYGRYARSRKAWGINALGTMVVQVEADDGTVGTGVSIGGEPGEGLKSLRSVLPWGDKRGLN